jgi:hypothetical protein
LTTSDLAATQTGVQRANASDEEAGDDERAFFDVATQIYLQLECDDARAMLFDGGKDIQIKLCRQLALAHEASIKLLQRAMGEYNTLEAARLANVATRLMSVFQQGAIALRHIQTGNDQRVTVQQVNVSGGNAVVAANVSTGRRPSTGQDEEEK